MGDALPTWYGVQLALRRGVTDAGPTRLALAQACTETILRDGAAAHRDTARGEATAAVDRVVEAIVCCSGVARFGMLGNHVLHPAEIAECRRRVIHGEFVTFGLLTRLVLGGELPESLPDVLAFCQTVELPARLADFELEDISDDALLGEARRIVAAAAADFGTGRAVGAREIVDAMREVADRGAREGQLRRRMVSTAGRVRIKGRYGSRIDRTQIGESRPIRLAWRA